MITSYTEDFLVKLEHQKIRKQYAKITLLSWKEEPLKDITSEVINGNISINGDSPLRRTGSISIVGDPEINYSTFLLNKKVSFQIGLSNQIDKQYPDIIWFPMGIFVVTGLSISHSVSSVNINIDLKDKMCLLNGSIAGQIPSVHFDSVEEEDANGKSRIVKIPYPTIIYNLLTEYGKERPDKILIEIDEEGRSPLTFLSKLGEKSPIDTLYCTYEKKAEMSEFKQFYFSDTRPSEGIRVFSTEDLLDKFDQKMPYLQFNLKDDIGQEKVFHYYPKELISKAGDSVCSILDQLKNMLGNYEYFYDINGNFVFREIKNYLNKSKINEDIEDIQNDLYNVDYYGDTVVYNFDQTNLISTYSNNPLLEEIKNDFVIWGERESVGQKNKIPIRYHLAIDNKPYDIQEGKMKDGYPVYPALFFKGKGDSAKYICEVASEKDIPLTSIGFFFTTPDKTNVLTYISDEDNKLILKKIPYADFVKEHPQKEILIKDWRTQLYLDGIVNEPLALPQEDYFQELKVEWPKIYNFWDGADSDFRVAITRGEGDYFLDFIDAKFSPLGDIGIPAIGRRTKQIQDNKVNCLFLPTTPNFIIEEAQEGVPLPEREPLMKNEYYAYIPSLLRKKILIQKQGNRIAAFDVISNYLYEYTSLNESITLNSLPIYSLDVNTRIRVIDLKSAINGEYIVKSISFSLGEGGSSNITAYKAKVKI